MLKYVSKFILDILPSLVATVIGAYIVNHYIVTRPEAPAASVAATAVPKVDANARTDIKASDAPADPAAAPEIAPAKGKTPVEKAVFEKAPPEKAVEKSVDTASAPAEVRRRPAAVREKSIAKAVPAPAPTIAAPAAASPAENVSAEEERKDANDLARAAIERLRTSGEPATRAARASEVPRAASPPTVQALPPPILVSTPRAEPFNSATGSLKSSDAAAARSEDASRPPAEIPASGPPLDLRAEAASPGRERTTVADDMMAAAKSVFHNMLPH